MYILELKSLIFQEHSLVPKLFGPLRERYLNRPGGYTRLLHIPNRVGDNAKMAVLELVDNKSECDNGSIVYFRLVAQ